MRVISIAVAVALLALIALTLIPAAGDARVYLEAAALAAAAVLLATILGGWTEKSPTHAPVASVEPAKAAPPAAPANVAEAEVVSFLATLQAKGRLVDFLMDDLTGYTDAQVGAVARVVQEGCKAVLREQLRILPVREENEGSTVTVAAGYPPDEYRLVGKISGQAPFRGTLVHRGWKTDAVKLPRLMRVDDNRLPTIAPAEVELK